MEKSEVPQEEPCKDDEFQKLLLTLPEERNWDGTSLYLYQGFWCPSIAIKPVFSFQQHFQALGSDLILASTPKSGTTWLKALTFSILNRTRYTLKDSPLHTTSPHGLVPFVEFDVYLKNKSPNLMLLPSPRIFATHVPYGSLPSSIKESNCRIVYVCRNAVDQLISYWHFALKLRRGNVKPLSLDEGFEKFCHGVHSFGPFAEHVLGYWKANLDRPKNVLFLKYEDMKEDVFSHTKRLAEFLGCPFSAMEEEQGVIQEICGLCSFENLKDLEVNKSGKRPSGVPNSAFFRNGKVGDWGDHLSPSKAEYLEKLIEEKLSGSGLTLKICPKFQKEDECKPSSEMEA